MRFYQLLFCILSISINAQKVKKTKLPDWVKKIDIADNDQQKQEGAFNYLLIDLQDNLISKEQFVHYAVKVLNSDGVQELSDISSSYDPAFQTLEFHIVNIIRDGKPIEKLANSIINSFRRETNLERSLYDGSLTAVINLADVREGDIIEYAYTIKGFNPVNKGNYSSVFYQQYTLPVDRIYTRLVTNSKNRIQYKLFNNASDPKIVDENSFMEYIWDTNGLNNFIYDVNVPYWLNSQSRVSISTFKDWKEVSDLLNPLYKSINKNLKNPIIIDEKLDTKQDVIIKLIRFVQDEVRYLGFEAGIGAYKPNDPLSVLSRRYGDCKDKSLLLSSLLQNQGVTAYPILVNTQPTEDLDKLLPSHYLFNHCIVYFENDGEEYFVDPTISNQGGDLSRISTPDYKFGFILKEGNEKLTSIPKPNKPSLRIVEDIVIDSIGGNATFTVKSEYSGSKADFMRAYFKNNTEESINKEFLNFYSGIYPGISSLNEITYVDDSRPWENIFTTEESYEIESLWSSMDNNNGIYFETYPLVLESLINYTKSAKRNMPYYLGIPHSFNQTTRITLPEPWNVNEEIKTVEDEAFTYTKEVSKVGNVVSLDYKYNLRKEAINGNLAASFLSKNNKLREQLGFQLFYDNSVLVSNDSNLSWLSIIITLITLSISIIFTIKLYKNYNPPSRHDKETQSIGGWMVLPAIGLVLTPFYLLFQLFSAEYYNKAIWSGFENAGYENAEILNIYLGFELIANIAFLVFSVLLNVLFFNKRTSVPIMMVYFYSINLGLILLGSFVMNQFGIDDPTFFKDLSKGLIGAVIWIPYFLNSERVKNTFVKINGNPISK
ncbi:DUF3857 domain-containing protein [Maribacter sp. 2210JD10-5]|uniref:DUF3857 domain-containing protein n=1 Tax=Maribacter sp. 2210JD10-5 TaxID=3386272 RepID=UPI0039BD3DBB